MSRKPRSPLEPVAAAPVVAEEPLEEDSPVAEEEVPPEAVVDSPGEELEVAAVVSPGEAEEEPLVEAGAVSRCLPLSCPFVFLRRSGKRELFDGIMCLNILLCS